MTTRLLTIALLFAALGATFQAHAQSKPPAASGSNNNGGSMAHSPDNAAASSPAPANPDNMPIKRPVAPPNSDRMLHNNPASDAIAK